MMFSDCEGFFEVYRRECHKYECLEKCDEYLEKPKRKNENTTNRSNWDKCPEICHDTDERNSGKYICKKSNWERKYTGKLSEKVNPSDRNIDNFFYNTRTTPVKNIVPKMME